MVHLRIINYPKKTSIKQLWQPFFLRLLANANNINNCGVFTHLVELSVPPVTSQRAHNPQFFVNWSTDIVRKHLQSILSNTEPLKEFNVSAFPISSTWPKVSIRIRISSCRLSGRSAVRQKVKGRERNRKRKIPKQLIFTKWGLSLITASRKALLHSGQRK